MIGGVDVRDVSIRAAGLGVRRLQKSYGREEDITKRKVKRAVIHLKKRRKSFGRIWLGRNSEELG